MSSKIKLILQFLMFLDDPGTLIHLNSAH